MQSVDTSIDCPEHRKIPKPTIQGFGTLFYGAPEGTRTPDLLVRSLSDANKIQ